MGKEILKPGEAIGCHFYDVYMCGQDGLVLVRAVFGRYNNGNKHYDSFGPESPPWQKFIYAPSWLDRLMGLSFEDELACAEARVCDAAHKELVRRSKDGEVSDRP